jgi:hypothetical protein
MPYNKHVYYEETLGGVRRKRLEGRGRVRRKRES